MVVENEILKKDDYIYFKVKGVFENINMNNELVNYSKIISNCVDEYNCRNVLLDISKLEYDINSINRYRVGLGIQKLFAKHFVRIACLRNKNVIDDFAEIVASNRGAVFKFFNNKKKAIEWLKE